MTDATIDLPEPFTTDADLRGTKCMPLPAALLDELVKSGAPAAVIVTTLRLRAIAYVSETPAASLPNDIRALAERMGTDTETVTAALHDWTLCRDGRLHHAGLASLAAAEWRQRLANRQRQAKYRDRHAGSDEPRSRRTAMAVTVTASADCTTPTPTDEAAVSTTVADDCGEQTSEAHRDHWRRIFGILKRTGRWRPEWGPDPHAPNCEAPADMLQAWRDDPSNPNP